MNLSPFDPQESAALRTVVETFIQERLQPKLDKLGAEDYDKRQKLREDHQRESWLTNAAASVKYLQLATHTVKPIHPSIKGATSIYLSKPWIDTDSLVGTHTLKSEVVDDVAVENAAALYVWAFLKCELGGKTLLKRMMEHDPAMLNALSDDLNRAEMLVAAFVEIGRGKSPAASHTLGKQLYFPVAADGYHLLAPLFPTALVHNLHTTLQVDRFSDATKAAREARKANQDYPQGLREYPNMVVQNFGGSKPQNVSQLNSERGGANHLLPSVPPVWHSEGIKPPLRQASTFDKGGPVRASRDVRFWTQKLRKYLVKELDRNNVHIRDKRAKMVDEIIYAVLDLSAQIQCLPSGWSQSDGCRLSVVEKRWLDPDAVKEADKAHETGDATPATDWRNDVAERFGSWLNAAIATDKTLMGDDEFLAWKYRFLEKLRDET